jgi:D-2-hydroxyglutarate dehydrogenase
MHTVLSFDPSTGALVCEAGCVLGNLATHLAPLGWMMPLDLGAKGSCQIGGNVSTNAGGLRYLRYGSLHGSVLGLEAVAGTGDVLNTLSRLRKDNVGYDVKQLFIGSEGTLGVITAVAIQAVPLPTSTQVVMLACPSFEACTAVLRVARAELGELLSAAEFVDGDAMDIMLGSLRAASGPIAASAFPFATRDAPFYVVLETQVIGGLGVGG